MPTTASLGGPAPSAPLPQNPPVPSPVQAQEKARTLVEALPYIRSYRGQTVVVKIGGEALDDPRLAVQTTGDLTLMALVGIRLVVIHGGGPQVSEAMSQAGHEPRFIAGLRVTDDATLETVRRVLVGSINSDLVTRLCVAGLSAVGLAGSDGRLLEAERVRGPNGEDLGRVGRVTTVQAGILESLLDSGHTPVIASIAPAVDGTLLNVNADTVAGAVAGALRAVKLVYLTNVEGLYRDLGAGDAPISEIGLDELRAMTPHLSAGMRPKAASAVEAMDVGVDKVHILDGRVEHALLLEVFTDSGIGTQVVP
jgi:acetylglutamate kinase